MMSLGEEIYRFKYWKSLENAVRRFKPMLLITNVNSFRGCYISIICLTISFVIVKFFYDV